MIQKRYEYFGPKGKKWTEWFNMSGKKDSDLKQLQEEEAWQVKGKLKNEYKIV